MSMNASMNINNLIPVYRRIPGEFENLQNILLTLPYIYPHTYEYNRLHYLIHAHPHNIRIDIIGGVHTSSYPDSDHFNIKVYDIRGGQLTPLFNMCHVYVVPYYNQYIIDVNRQITCS